MPIGSAHRSQLQRIRDCLPPALRNDPQPVELLVQQVVQEKDDMERQIELTITEHIEQLDNAEHKLGEERRALADLRAQLEEAQRRATAEATARSDEQRYGRNHLSTGTNRES